MRSSGLFLSLALVLCIQFTSVLSQEQKFVGIWKNPSKPSSISSSCCVPDAVTIEKSGSEWTAYYDYSSSNLMCNAQFTLADKKATVQTYNTGNYKATFYVSLLGVKAPHTYAYFTPSGSNLVVSDGFYSSSCTFTMTTRQDLPVIGTGAIVVIIIVIVIVIIIIKSKQNKQANLIIQQNNPSGPGYVAPMNFNPQFPQPQAFPQQPQAFNQQPQAYPQGYPQPQPFPQNMPMPNAQVTMNVNADFQRPM